MEDTKKLARIIKECGSYSVELDGYVINPITVACKILNAGYHRVGPVQKVDCQHRSNGHCLAEQMYENTGKLNPKDGVFINCSEENMQYGSCPYREFVPFSPVIRSRGKDTKEGLGRPQDRLE